MVDTHEKLQQFQAGRLGITDPRHLEPTLGAILVRYLPDEEETKSKGGIIMKHGENQFLVNAEVMKVSDPILASGERMKSEIEIGDRVLLEKRDGIIIGKFEEYYYKVLSSQKQIVLKVNQPSPIIT